MSNESVFGKWHKRITRVLQNEVFKELLKDLKNMPKYTHITDRERKSLREIARTFEVDLSDYDLSNDDDFYDVKGLSRKKAVKMLREDMKPRDPLMDMVGDLKESEDEEEEEIDEQDLKELLEG